MKKLWEALENKEWTALEIVLTISVAFMGGVAAGMALSPKGTRFFGCYNGSNWADEIPESVEDEE